jgi:hypothetical protein
MLFPRQVSHEIVSCDVVEFRSGIAREGEGESEGEGEEEGEGEVRRGRETSEGRAVGSEPG